MAGRKLTELTATEALSNDDLVYAVDIDAAVGSKSKGITKANLAAQMSTSVASSEPVENEYADITALLADQGNQTESFLQYVVDASDDPNIASGEAYYEKLSGSTTTLADDYRLLSDTEVEVVRDSNSYRVFRIQAIQDDGTPLTSVNGGRISFEYSGANVTAILFNKRYTDAIAEFYNTDVNIRFYNRATRKYQTESIASGAWTTVNTDYYRGAVTGTNIQIADLTVTNRIEFFISSGTNASGGGSSYIYDVKTYNAKGDGIDLEDGAITSSDASFSSATASFSSDDVGKVIAIKGAGTSGAYHVTTIATFTDANNIEITDNAITTVSGATFFYGTDDTVNIQTTIQTCYDAGGGTVFIPEGIYIINGALQNNVGTDLVDYNSQLYIPQIDGTEFSKPSVAIVGEVMPNFRNSGGIGTGRTDNGGTVLRSTIQGSGTKPSVICNKGASGNILSMSFTNVYCENLMVHTLPDANNKITIGALNFEDSKIAIVENIVSHPYALNMVDSGEPDVIDITGIALPKNNCEHQVKATNCNVAGFTNGYLVSDHGNLYDVTAICCTNGIVVKDAVQVANIVKAVIHWCANDITISGTLESYLYIHFLQSEAFITGGKWYDYIYTINDASEFGNGIINYSIIEPNVGVNNQLFRRNGGLNIKATGVGNSLNNTITAADTMLKDWFNISNIYNSASDATITIPLVSTSTSYSPNLGDIATFTTKDVGNLQFEAATGAVSILTKTTDFLQTNGINSKVIFECIGLNEYIITGDLQLYTAVNWAADLISYYKFNDDLLDAVGSNDGTGTAITYVTGKSGNAADFNGTTSDISVADSADLSFGNGTTDSDFSISGFFNFDTLGVDGLVNKRLSGTQFEYQLRYNSTTLEFTLFSALAASAYLRASYTWTPTTSTWYHIAITYDGSSTFGGITIYVDGVDVGALTDGSVGSYVAMNNGTAPVYIGNLFSGSGNRMDGTIDGLGIWSKELTSTEVGDIYTQQNGGTELV